MIKIFLTTDKKETIKDKHIKKLVNEVDFFKDFLNKLLTDSAAMDFFSEKIDNLIEGDLKENLKKDIELLKSGINIKHYGYKEEDKFKGLKKIFIAEKDELDEIIKAFGKGEGYPKNISSIITFFHDYYKKFRGWRKNWGGALFVSELDVRTCVYCNSSYVYKYKNDKNQLKTTAELDHYYSKEEYFYLAMSIFNLFPSCGNCNGIKSTKSKNVMYPYEKGLEGLGKFSIKRTQEFINEMTKICPDKEKIEIKIENFSRDPEVDNWKEVFCLEGRYQNYKTEVSEILTKNRVYTNERLEEIAGLVELDIKTLENILFDYRQDEKNYKDKILSKFTSDILKDIREVI